MNKLFNSKMDCILNLAFEFKAMLYVIFCAILIRLLFFENDGRKVFVHYIKNPYDEENKSLRRSARLAEKNKN
jgi:hypothetical protein